jgi:hypothetical protein
LKVVLLVLVMLGQFDVGIDLALAGGLTPEIEGCRPVVTALLNKGQTLSGSLAELGRQVVDQRPSVQRHSRVDLAQGLEQPGHAQQV